MLLFWKMKNIVDAWVRHPVVRHESKPDNWKPSLWRRENLPVRVSSLTFPKVRTGRPPKTSLHARLAPNLGKRSLARNFEILQNHDLPTLPALTPSPPPRPGHLKPGLLAS